MIKLEGVLLNPENITFIERTASGCVIHFTGGETVICDKDETALLYERFDVDKDDWRNEDRP